MLQDVAWSMGYHSILNEKSGDSDHIFPEFACKITNDDGNIDSETAKVFKGYFEQLVNVAKKY